MSDDLFDDDLPAIMGYSSKCGTMADGSLRIQIDVQPKDAQKAFRLFGTPGSAIALARLTDETAVEADKPKAGTPEKKSKGPYGDFAQALVKSGFFRIPAIWEAIGSDDEYLAWLKTQKSAKSGEFSWYEDTGEGYCVPAHYRRVEHGSGTSFKPKYCAIPLTNDEHQLQHNQGHDAIGDRDWWDKKRIKYVESWAFETLKKRMCYASYTEIPPGEMIDWAEDNNVDHLLPQMFYEWVNGKNTEGQAESEA